MPSNAILNFTRGDAIDLANILATSASYSGGVLTLMNGSSTVAQLNLAAPGSHPHFGLGADGTGRTLIDLEPPPPADFNGDGKSDILWQYNNAANASDPFNGEAAIWLMDGMTPISQAIVGTPPPSWHAIGTGDFNGDGKADILFQYNDAANASDPSNGEAAIWLMNGLMPTSPAIIGAPPPSWHAIGTGDFNGDGKSDILFQYNHAANAADPSNGEAAIWLMNGTTPISQAIVGAPPPS